MVTWELQTYLLLRYRYRIPSYVLVDVATEDGGETYEKECSNGREGRNAQCIEADHFELPNSCL